MKLSKCNGVSNVFDLGASFLARMIGSGLGGVGSTGLYFHGVQCIYWIRNGPPRRRVHFIS